MNRLDQSTLDRIVSDAAKKKDIYGAVFYVSSDDCSVDAISAAGNMTPSSRYYIASINKLFVSAVILRLYADNKLDLDDKIAAYLPGEVVQGLHVYKGTDYSNDLTIRHLISQTSGLPCYLLDRQPNGKPAVKDLEAGIDQAWPIDKAIRAVKQMEPHFPPGAPGRAHYGDTNHQILSLIIETVTGEPVHRVLNALFAELHMPDTYVCEDVNDTSYAPVYCRSNIIRLPQFFTSTQNDIISTAQDQMTFLKAFFNGHFFPKERLSELEKWNNIFSPFKYGVGIQMFSLPRIFSPFQPVPTMIGHCGSTGSLAFKIPSMGLYVTGTINQQANPNIAFQTIIRILSRVRQAG